MVNYDIIKHRATELLFPNVDSKITEYRDYYAWYRNDNNSIKTQIQKSLYKSIVKNWSKITKKIKRYPHINKIPKILTRLSNLYTDPPERTITINGEVDDELTEMYNTRVNNLGLNMIMSDNHKLAIFFNTILVGPYFEDGELYLRTYLPFEYIVIPNPQDASRMDALLLLNRKEIEPDVFEDSVIVWTKEKHYVITSDLMSKAVNKNVEKKNPYGIIPFAVLRMRKDNYDFQGCGLEWLVEICLSASVNETYKNFLIPYNIGGILIAKNLNLDKTKQKDPFEQLQLNNETIDMEESKNSSIEISPDSVLSLKESYQGKDASLQFLSLQSDLSVVHNEVDWLIKNSLSDAGLDLNSIVIERGYTSGFGIVAESQGLMEIRKGYIPVLAKFEQDLFKIIKVLLSFEEDISESYPEDAILSIDYAEPVFPRTIEEIQKERKMQIEQNTRSYIDFIKEDNIDITDDAMARKKLEENYKINKEFESIFGISGSSVFGDNTDVDENDTAPIENNLEHEEPIINNPTSITNVEIEIPNDRQFSYWDCGDAVAVSALARFGIEPNPDSLAEELGSTEKWGTEPENIKSVLESYGLTVDMRAMTIEDIKNYIDNNITVILDIQAWHSNIVENYDYTNEWQDGHYVTAYGYTDTTIKIKDPSGLINRELTYDELQSRWHDIDRKGNKLYNIGIAYYGLPIIYSNAKTVSIG